MTAPRVRVFAAAEVRRIALSNGLPPYHKLMIAVLAEWADPERGHIPLDARRSIAEIARAVGVSETTVKKVLRELESWGWLARNQHKVPGTRYSEKTGYRLLVPGSHQSEVGRQATNGGASGDPPPPAPTQNRRSRLVASRPEVLSTSSTGKPKASRSRKKLYCSEFAAWYEIYPRHQGKADAAKSFQRSVLDDRGKPPSDRFDATDLASLMEATRRFAEWVDLKRIERQYVKLPATWLNKACWNDELDMTPVPEPEEETGMVNLCREWS